MMEPLERIRSLIRIADPDGTVTVRWLASLVGERIPGEAKPTERRPDLTVDDVATEMKRAPSTVRGWLIAGELRGYKLNGRDWRVPRSALDEYRERQAGPPPPAPRDGSQVDISEWRKAS